MLLYPVLSLQVFRSKEHKELSWNWLDLLLYIFVDPWKGFCFGVASSLPWSVPLYLFKSLAEKAPFSKRKSIWNRCCKLVRLIMLYLLRSLEWFLLWCDNNDNKSPLECAQSIASFYFWNISGMETYIHFTFPLTETQIFFLLFCFVFVLSAAGTMVFEIFDCHQAPIMDNDVLPRSVLSPTFFLLFFYYSSLFYYFSVCHFITYSFLWRPLHSTVFILKSSYLALNILNKVNDLCSNNWLLIFLEFLIGKWKILFSVPQVLSSFTYLLNIIFHTAITSLKKHNSIIPCH